MELGLGIVLLLGAFEVGRRRLSGRVAALSTVTKPPSPSSPRLPAWRRLVFRFRSRS
jgi:hypothetical protein